MQLAPSDEKKPASHMMHSFAAWSVRYPGLHAVHAADPSVLNPLSHGVHSSLAPMLNVFSGHGSCLVRSAFGRFPAVAVEQNDACLAEYLPFPSHGEHSPREKAPEDEKVDAGQSEQAAPS